MAASEQPLVPLWAEAKAKKQVDVLKEAARTIEEAERLRAGQPVDSMTEQDLEAEQLRLEDRLHDGSLTVEEFRRLREIDFYLDGMRWRRENRPAQQERKPEWLSDE
jgi:hypothetical protein